MEISLIKKISFFYLEEGNIEEPFLSIVVVLKKYNSR